MNRCGPAKTTGVPYYPEFTKFSYPSDVTPIGADVALEPITPTTQYTRSATTLLVGVLLLGMAVVTGDEAQAALTTNLQRLADASVADKAAVAAFVLELMPDADLNELFPVVPE